MQIELWERGEKTERTKRLYCHQVRSNYTPAKVNQRHSMKRFLLFGLLVSALTLTASPAPPDDGKLRIICFGAHPDDCELQVGGVAAMWSAKGHHVKLVSVSNGDIGHWKEAGGPLAQRRKAEALHADQMLGASTEVLDIHDGEIWPSLENRRMIVRLIREWRADVVMGPRPNDYHPDHRYTSVLVQDAAYMVTVPFFCPDVPYLKNNPVFFYYTDRFMKPTPSAPDIAINIDPVAQKKLDAVCSMVSQFYEGGANGYPDLMPTDPDKQEARRKVVRTGFENRFHGIATRFRPKLVEFYGQEKGNAVQYSEAFEICEYGRQPGKEELKKLFPFFGE
jgi:N-acetylglucosamine malate deacetylase 1